MTTVFLGGTMRDTETLDLIPADMLPPPARKLTLISIPANAGVRALLAAPVEVE